MLKPLGDRVIVKVEEEKEQTVGGFVLAGARQAQTKIASVVAVGQGARSLTGELIAPSIAEGDRILVDAVAGVEVTDGDDKVLVVHEADILAILA